MKNKLLSVFVSALLTGNIASAATNLLVNPKLESANKSCPSGWSKYEWGRMGTQEPVVETEFKTVHSEGKAIRLYGRQPQSAAIFMQAGIKVKGNTRYLLTAWVNLQTATPPLSLFRLQVQLFDATNHQLSGRPIAGECVTPKNFPFYNGNSAVVNTQTSLTQDIRGSSSEWVRIGYVFETPKNANSATVQLVLCGQGIAYADDICMIENPGEPAPTFAGKFYSGKKISIAQNKDGKRVLHFEMDNIWKEDLKNLRFTVEGSCGKLAEMQGPEQIAPGKCATMEIPLKFPGEFSSDLDQVKLTAQFSRAGRDESVTMNVFAGIPSASVIRTLFSEGIDTVPLQKKDKDIEVAMCASAESDGSVDIESAEQPLRLTDKTEEMNILIQVKGNPTAPRNALLEWELLDYFFRPVSGSAKVTIPAGQSRYVKIAVPKKQLNRFKQVLDNSYIQFYRLNCKLKSDGKVREFTRDLSFVLDKTENDPLGPLSPRKRWTPCFGPLPLIDEVFCGNASDPHLRRDGGKGLKAKYSSEPLGFYGGEDRLSFNWHKNYRDDRENFSDVRTILGKECRVAENNGWFSYYLGRGAMKTNDIYLLELEYPEDESRSMHLSLAVSSNSNMGIRTGSALGDSPTRQAFMQVSDLPLSGKMRSMWLLFRPVRASGWFGVFTMSKVTDPLSHGAAVHAMRIYRVCSAQDLARFKLTPREPEGLPKRLLGYLSEDNTQNPWNLQRYAFYGINAYAPLALIYCGLGPHTRYANGEVRWDSKVFDGKNAQHPLAKKIPGYFLINRIGILQDVALAKQNNMLLMPALEYGGTAQLPEEALARKPDGSYLPYGWGKNDYPFGTAIDMAHPAVGIDIGNMLTELASFLEKNGSIPAGFILTPRMAAWQVGFGLATLKRFAADSRIVLPEKNPGKWIAEKHLDAFMKWHYEQKRLNLRKAAEILHAKYPTVGFYVQNYNCGDDNLFFGNPLFYQGDKKYPFFITPGATSLPDLRNVNLLAMMENYRSKDIGKQTNGLNPKSYRNEKGVNLMAPARYPYLCGNADYLNAFRTAEGSTVCMYWLYNEDIGGADPFAAGRTMPGLFGYDASGRFSMLDEIMTMAASDPKAIFVRMSEYNRAYPEYVREFAMAYRALPAVPSVLHKTGKKDIVYRTYDTKQGRWLAVINTVRSFDSAMLELSCEEAGGTALLDLSTGKTIKAQDGKFTIESQPVSLRSFRVTKE